MNISYRIPEDCDPLVKEGEKIDFKTFIISKKIDKDLEINVAEHLDIDSKNIFRYLKKLVGEKINKDDVLAEKKGFFSTSKTVSPVDGIIKEVDHHKGIIIITTSSKDKNKILSPFIGEVEKINKNNLQIKVGKGEEFSVKNASADFGGEVVYFEKDHAFNWTELTDKVMISEKINSFLQVKTEALGIKGFVTSEKLSEKTEVNYAFMKSDEDLKKIKKSHFSYCTVISQSDKIYFYQ